MFKAYENQNINNEQNLEKKIIDEEEEKKNKQDNININENKCKAITNENIYMIKNLSDQRYKSIKDNILICRNKFNSNKNIKYHFILPKLYKNNNCNNRFFSPQPFICKILSSDKILRKNISYNDNKNKDCLLSNIISENKKDKNATEEIKNGNLGYFSSNENNNIFIPMLPDNHSSRDFNYCFQQFFKNLSNKNNKNNALKMDLKHNYKIKEKNGSCEFFWGAEKIIPKLHKIKIEKGMATNSKFAGNLSKKIININYHDRLTKLKKYKFTNMVSSVNSSNENIDMISKKHLRSNSCNIKNK